MSSAGRTSKTWKIEKIAVIGPGIVGMPMAALLAHARICEGTDQPAKVIVVQRNSPTSGWKVDAINQGRSPIGGIEPDLDQIIAKSVAAGLLWASHDYADLRDADVILVCVQTDKKELGPDYGPLFSALTDIATALQQKPSGKQPLIIFESTLAPSSMITLIKAHFAKYGLEEGRDILLGNSPNRVMPGRLVHRVANSDKIVAGLSPQTPEMIYRLYARIVPGGTLYKTNSLTAEIVKTLENAYRDVRIAYAAEIVRYCDQQDIDFYQVRNWVNARLAQTDAASGDPNAVPSGGLLVPTIGVGGHCLPKDGILLWWRKIESGADTSHSLILQARQINDESPAESIRLAERSWGELSGKSIALFGVAYRFNSEDTRNAPTLQLALQLLEKGCIVSLHDPYVKCDDQNVVKFNLQTHFTQDMAQALQSADYLIFCTAHKLYIEQFDQITQFGSNLRGMLDGCNLFPGGDLIGIGRGKQPPSAKFVDFVYDGFQVVEKGVANEVRELVEFFNAQYVKDAFNRIDFARVQEIAGTCVTGCAIVAPGPIETIPVYQGFSSRLVKCAHTYSQIA
jgi:UDP-N-acetyl-D-mannosaminuronic acid dehydrogenase